MVKRGCGSRQENGLYVCVQSSAEGMPVEYFLVDPVLEWKGARTLRAPMLVEDRGGVNHLVMGIGKTFYPTVPDFVEEIRVLGVSKRLPSNFDFSGLVPFESRLLLMHPRAIPQFEYEVKRFWCPKGIRRRIDGQEGEAESHLCIGDLWGLSGLENFSDKHEIVEENEHITVKTPSVSYHVAKASAEGRPKYSSGIILMFPQFHFEYVNHQGEAPKEVREKVAKAGFILDIKEE